MSPERGVGAPAIFAIALGAAGSSIYYILGVVSGDALGLTPVVFLLSAVFFVVTMMTYLEGNSLHPERGGASTFARYAFNELWSFVAGWVILLDYLIVLALGSFAVSHYLAAFAGWADDKVIEHAIAGAALAYVAVSNIRGLSADRYSFVLRLGVWNLTLALRDRGGGRGEGLRRPQDHRLDPPRQRPDRQAAAVRRGGRHRCAHGHRGGLRPRRGSEARQAGAQTPRGARHGHDPRLVRGDLDRRPDGAARDRRPHCAVDPLDRGADPGGRRRLPRSELAAPDAALPGGRHGRARARHRAERPDARHLPPRLLARHQPPDPERDRQAPRRPLHALRRHHDRGGDRLRR